MDNKQTNYVNMLDKEGGLIQQFDSSMTAAQWLVDNHKSKTIKVESVRTSVRAVLNKNKTYLGYKWQGYEKLPRQSHKIKNDAYFTEEEIAKKCIEMVWQICGTDWDRIIEPMVGDGVFFDLFKSDNPNCEMIGIDIEPTREYFIKNDYRKYKVPYMERSIVIGNPAFGRANKLSVQTVKHAMEMSPYCAIIQPISQLNQNRTMKDTELIYSEDLGVQNYVGRPVHCCFNIYHKCKDGHKTDYKIEGIEGRHIFRSGKYQHNDDILNTHYDFRINAWGEPKLLQEEEFCPNEIVYNCKTDEMREWLGKQLQVCPYRELIKAVSTPNLPIWRLNKWLKEQFDKNFS